MQEQAVAVDEVVGDEPLDEGAAAQDDDVPVAPRLEVPDRRAQIAASACAPCQRSSVSVRVATCFGVALRCAAIGFSSDWFGQKALIFS